jgi:hypothetical protein
MRIERVWQCLLLVHRRLFTLSGPAQIGIGRFADVFRLRKDPITQNQIFVSCDPTMSGAIRRVARPPVS